MCYHTASPKKENLKKIVEPQVKIFDYPEKEFLNGFDKPSLPVMLNTSPEIIKPAIWDFTPPNQKFSYTTLNARSETLFTSPLYGESAKIRRCLVFMQGMYEWSPTKVKSKKQPYYIERTDKKPFAVGGIWKDWGNGHVTFSIVTTPANELFTELRPEVPRMLFLMDNDIWGTWLNNNTTIDQLNELMKPYKDGEFTAIPLDKSPLARK